MTTSSATLDALVAACKNGDRLAPPRLISLLESPDPQVTRAASRVIASLPLPKHCIGITGPPGSGKSTLLDYTIGLIRARGQKVAVIAVDPSSPFTGGALLGDRIRMSSHRSDPGVFIRSMGSRGTVGGLAGAAADALRVLGGAGYDTVFLETVGAGQTETEIVRLADTIAVVQVAGLGDDVQLMKMGILEIADLFIVNKADRPGAKELQIQIQMALHESPGEVCRALRQLGPAFRAAWKGPEWTPPVVLVSALEQNGGADLLAAFDGHKQFLTSPGLSDVLMRQRLARELVWRATRRFGDALEASVQPGGALEALVRECADGKLPLEEAVERALRTTPGQAGSPAP